MAAPFVHFYPALLLLLWWAAWRCRRGSRRPRILLLLLAALSLLSWSPMVRWSFLIVESSATAAETAPEAAAIVVLSGSIRQPDDWHPQVRLGSSTYLRCKAAALVAKSFPTLPVVVSGGRIQANAEVSLAAAMRDQLVADGIRTERIWLEEHSTTTWENATETAQLLRDHGIRRVALVTEAYHMPRSVLCFEAQGLEVIPYPCEFRSRSKSLHARDLLPNPNALHEHERLFHELVGALYYRLRGRV